MNSENSLNKRKFVTIDVEPYLARIQLEKKIPNLSYLQKLHQKHLFNIPFENLDVHYSKRITLDFKKIYDKIILSNRGGFCYELNGLFYHLLLNLGFNATVGSARVYHEDKLSPEYDHMIVFVEIDGTHFLCDVGFGNSFWYPLKIESMTPQLDNTSYYRFQQHIDGYWVLEKSKDNSQFKKLYRFDLVPKQVIQFLSRCEYHQTSMESQHTRQKVISKMSLSGTVQLTGRELTKKLFGEIEVKPIMNEDEFLYHLREEFGIDTYALTHQQFD